MRNRALESMKTHEKEMRKKWNVRSPFPPPQGTPRKTWDRLPFLGPLAELRSLEVISPFAATKQGIIGKLVEGYDPLLIQADYESFRQKDGKRRMIYRGGKHLCMIVDLTKPETEILREMKGYLKGYQSLLPHGTLPSQKRKRRKPTTAVRRGTRTAPTYPSCPVTTTRIPRLQFALWVVAATKSYTCSSGICQW